MIEVLVLISRNENASYNVDIMYQGNGGSFRTLYDPDPICLESALSVCKNYYLDDSSKEDEKMVLYDYVEKTAVSSADFSLSQTFAIAGVCDVNADQLTHFLIKFYKAISTEELRGVLTTDHNNGFRQEFYGLKGLAELEVYCKKAFH